MKTILKSELKKLIRSELKIQLKENQRENDVIINSLNEGLMANLDIIRQESKSLNDFIKKAKQEYPKLKNMENVDNWLKSIYED